MVTSMTGFGRGSAEAEGVRLKVELRSVNSRFCEIQVRSPAGLQELEPVVRQRLQERLTRGKIAVQVEWENGALEAELPVLDEAVVERYLRELERLGRLAGIPTRPDWEALLRLPGIFRAGTVRPDAARVEPLVMQALERAVDDFLQMRAAEGAALARDLRSRIAHIEARLQEIEILAAEQREQIRARLREKVEALLQPGEVAPERLALEVVLIAERSDITEEVVRFHSHNAQFTQALERGGEVGRRLNFLLQEMGRESNTINAKATHATIVHLAVEIKEDVERLREQVQNLA
ncbi:MAG: YicC/YloC family endoribonuclease [Candidatus Latescibacterota bacterium]